MTVTQMIARVRRLTNTTTSDYSAADLVQDINSELSMVQINILRDRGVLEFDDTNFADTPIGTFTVAADGVCKITEDDDSNKIITIHKVAFLSGGEYIDVPRTTIAEGSQDVLVRSGSVTVPTEYYEVGNSVVFPGVSGGTAKIWFDREMSFILTSDTTKVPGVPTAYHNLVCFRTALNYAIDMGLPNEDRILRRVQMEEDRLAQFEENRRDDEQTVMQPEVISGM